MKGLKDFSPEFSSRTSIVLSVPSSKVIWIEFPQTSSALRSWGIIVYSSGSIGRRDFHSRARFQSSKSSSSCFARHSRRWRNNLRGNHPFIKPLMIWWCVIVLLHREGYSKESGYFWHDKLQFGFEKFRLQYQFITINQADWWRMFLPALK